MKLGGRPLGPLVERARQVVLPVVLLAAVVFAAWFVDAREPAKTWLLWPYAACWAATLTWIVCCASLGHAALRLLPTLDLRFRERLLFDLAVGVLLFATGLFLVGIVGGLGGPFYVVYPLVLGALGVTFSLGDWRRAWRHFRAARKSAGLRPSLIHRAALVLGTLGLTIIGLSIMVPDNAAFDARSYHLPIAEHFAAGGRIGKFPEGWFAGALPHLASWLYTWPFTLRSVNLFGHVELAAHLEFALFVATVFSAPLLVEALLPGRRARGTWALFFLFPGLFLYDSSLGLAADHVLAFWAAPLALAVLRFLQQPSNRARGALAGLMLAGAALTKYQSIYLIVPAGLALGCLVVRTLWRARRPPRGDGDRTSAAQLLLGVGALALAAIVATAPHWLANVAWHGNPVYPQLRNLFPTHPLVPGWPGTTLDAQFELHGTFATKIRDSALNTFAFSFVPHDWWPFHRDLPVFGFLFTLTLPVLLLARGAGRARTLAAGALLGVFIWYWTYHEDRYLQALLPWMVACTAVALRLAWDAGRATRVGLTLLVALQIVWGGDVPWLPNHSMMHEAPAIRALGLLSSTYRGELRSRFSYDTGFEGLDHMLPKDAYVLLHEEYLRLGLNRRAIQDSLRLQAGIDYTQLARPDRVHDLLTSLGATHLVWGPVSVNHEIPISGELVFWRYAFGYGEARTNVGSFGVAKIPARRPPAREPGPAAYVGCDATRLVPLAEIDGTVTAEGRNGPPANDLAAAIAGAEFLIMKTPCQSQVPSPLLTPFEEAPRWGDVSLWVRRL